MSIEDLRIRAALTAFELEEALQNACVGPHKYIQHRDMRPPWCPNCHRTKNGYDKNEALRGQLHEQ